MGGGVGGEDRGRTGVSHPNGVVLALVVMCLKKDAYFLVCPYLGNLFTKQDKYYTYNMQKSYQSKYEGIHKRKHI